MKKQDTALTISNPRILAAVYFGLLSVVGTVLTDAFLSSLGIEEVVPLFKAVLLGMLVSSCTGAIFGERIVHCKKPYKNKTFWLGFFMVIASLPVFDLGLLLFLKEANTPLLSINNIHDMVFSWFAILVYSYILFGFLLAIGSGLAAMYLRGQLVYDILSCTKVTGVEDKPHSPRR